MPLLDPEEVSRRTHYAKATLAKLRVVGGGPPFVKLGAKVLYDEADLNDWIASKGKRRSTSDDGSRSTSAV